MQFYEKHNENSPENIGADRELQLKINQVKELATRFGLIRSEYVAQILRVSGKEARQLIEMANGNRHSDL